MTLPSSTCVWCDSAGATHWLCEACRTRSWYQGGARFVLAWLYKGWGRKGVYQLRIVDRAFGHQPLPYVFRENVRRRCRDLNYETRLEREAWLERRAAA